MVESVPLHPVHTPRGRLTVLLRILLALLLLHNPEGDFGEVLETQAESGQRSPEAAPAGRGFCGKCSRWIHFAAADVDPK